MRSVGGYTRGFLLAPSRRLDSELLLVLSVIVLWQAIRPLLEGSAAVALANAYDWLRLEERLQVDVEPLLTHPFSSGVGHDVLRWLYGNIHVPALFAFLAAARVAAPARYPFLRAVFVLSYVPAVLIIGLYPLAPPDWVPEFGIGRPPTDGELTSGWEAFENSTAAAASQHFGFAVFVAFGAFWIWRRSWIIGLAAFYPVLVFVVIVGTGEHYVLDCVVGLLTFVLAAGATFALGGRFPQAPHERPGPRPIVLAGLSAGLAAWGVESVIQGADGGRIVPAIALLLGVAALARVSRIAAVPPHEERVSRVGGARPRQARVTSTATLRLTARDSG